ncbi:Crp/Fnr family transcriptional regulator [Chitinophaga sp. sic0106]|uniref:Crp/Fnr family transcriptional regulator n=1 Tax=Chitinophaga sp. sic0106 TaxID=2854785 RepID=UPI001C46DA84|nr:Crp/Fnr family transcriptional regulator [Chitinophaga sp. sic0106]MBV7530695.1 Crp/Fnr family transcriptional regulator [Chitinophaga sp. sic0106]
MTAGEILQTFRAQHLFDRTITLGRNEYLKHAGTADTNIYLIEEGSVRIFIVDGEEERIIRFGYQGNIIVSLDSFLSGKPSEFYMQVIRKATISVIPKEKFMAFIRSSEHCLQLWVTILEDLVLQQVEREKDLLVNAPAERYERVLKRSPQLFQEIPHKYIANYLRMTPETLSRLKKS